MTLNQRNAQTILCICLV